MKGSSFILHGKKMNCRHGKKILIQIDPKMSFGTGHNETTQLVLELMSKYVRGTEENLFDFGCGTGIQVLN